jgi:GNAT superfamily N-acetyltransferase
MINVKNSSILISYITLRKVIGGLGVLLPIVCIIGGFLFSDLPAQRSISYYYHTNMRDFFIGILCCISIFLITYRGHYKIDDTVTTASGICGFLAAIFPCSTTLNSKEIIGILQIEAQYSNYLHLTFSIIFFLLLALNSIFLFTREELTAISREKLWRNHIYRISGGLIIGMLACISIAIGLFGFEAVDESCAIIGCEIFMLLAFGVSWFVKGRTILKDSNILLSSNNFRIKILEKEDLDSLLELYKELNPEDSVLPKSKALELWKEIHLSPNMECFIAVNESRTVVASCTIGILSNLTRSGRPYAIIENVITRSDYRMQGLARTLIEQSTAFAKKMDCYKIVLLSSTDRTDAHQFYTSIGFDGDSKKGFELRLDSNIINRSK